MQKIEIEFVKIFLLYLCCCRYGFAWTSWACGEPDFDFHPTGSTSDELGSLLCCRRALLADMTQLYSLDYLVLPIWRPTMGSECRSQCFCCHSQRKVRTKGAFPSICLWHVWLGWIIISFFIYSLTSSFSFVWLKKIKNFKKLKRN